MASSSSPTATSSNTHLEHHRGRGLLYPARGSDYNTPTHVKRLFSSQPHLRFAREAPFRPANSDWRRQEATILRARVTVYLYLAQG